MAQPTIFLKQIVVDQAEHVEFTETAGFLSIRRVNSEPCNITEKWEQLLLDTARVSKEVVRCRKLIDYWGVCGISSVHISELLGHRDFFLTSDGRDLANVIAEYHRKYGVPELDFLHADASKRKSILDTDLPAEWEAIWERDFEKNQKKRRRDDYMQDQDTLKILNLCMEADVYPLVWSVPFFVDFYRRFITEEEREAIQLDGHEMGIAVHGQITLLESRDRVLAIHAHGVENAAYAAAISLALNNGAVRICKQCGTAFIADRPSAEYCSTKCRGTYNTRMSRQKRKLREMIG